MPVALVSCRHTNPWLRQFPDGRPVWNDWRFLFNDAKGEAYDYLIALDDLAAPVRATCPRANTIHVSTEPPTVRQYDPRFTGQFGFCLTLDPAFDHPHFILSQPGLTWHLGWNSTFGNDVPAMSFRALEALFDEPRDKLISVIASNKRVTPDHSARLDFALRLKEHFGARMDFFGRGFVPMRDKLEALRGYRFHIVLENTRAEHYFSEKLSDCVISGCYPIYYGCPNVADYLPNDSFVPTGISDFETAIATIEDAIARNLDIERRDALREARRRIMYDENCFALLARTLDAHRRGEYGSTLPSVSYGEELLPYWHRRYHEMFGLKRELTWKDHLSELADRSQPALMARTIFRSGRRIMRQTAVRW